MIYFLQSISVAPVSHQRFLINLEIGKIKRYLYRSAGIRAQKERQSLLNTLLAEIESLLIKERVC
jgi:hypothetical protein